MNKVNKKDIIGVTMGDPSGIGPEIILKSYIHPLINKMGIMVIGDYKILEKCAEKLKINSFTLNKIEKTEDFIQSNTVLNVLDMDLIDLDEFQPGKVQIACGNAAFQYVKKAVELANNKQIASIATAPLNKEAMHKAGHNFPGHTEILAHYTNTKDYAMLLYDAKLNVIHVSTHVSLKGAIEQLKSERVEKVIQLADNYMNKIVKRKPKIAVAGINPHAGENGLFGDEEINIINPAVKKMKDLGIDVEGAVPPDTVFLKAIEGNYDIVVAMYHDQGHIPLKLLGFHSGVNITAGLPIIRTSVDHGTAFEIAWQGKAKEDSMIEAIKLAEALGK